MHYRMAVHHVQQPQQVPLRIRAPREKPEWQKRYDAEMAWTERWIVNLFFLWVLLLAYVTVDSRGDQLIMAGFFLWTAIALAIGLGAALLHEKISDCCGR